MFIRLHTTPAGFKRKRKNTGFELPEGATVGHALARYAERHRVSFDLNSMRGIVILRNGAVAWYDDVLEDGDEITLLRVYAGG